MHNQTYARGVLYAILGGVFLSFGGILVRFIDQASPWSILFYRSLTFTVTVAILLLFRDRRKVCERFANIRLLDLLVSFFLAIGFICYVLSLFNTSVANTVLLLSTGPVAAGVLAYLVLGETVRSITWFAMLIAIFGVFVMVSGGVDGSDFIGMGYAIAAVLSYACFVVLLRYLGPKRDMMAPIAIAGLVAAAMCVPMLSPIKAALTISMHDLAIALMLGSVQVGLGFILITLGSRSVPAAQIPLLGLSETALSPLWVWLAINEVPASSTVLGGAIVLIAVLLQGYSALQRN